MARFKCKKCGKEKNIIKQTIVIVIRNLRVKESLCECGEYMENMETYKGFGTSFKAENDKIN